MAEVIVEGKPVDDTRRNPHNTPGLPGYEPRKDPNNAHYEDPAPNVMTGSYIPGSGLLPSVPPAVDDPASPQYQDPGASDMLHSHPANVSIAPDGFLHIKQTEVDVSDKKGKEVTVLQPPDDSVLLAQGNKVTVNDPAADKEAEKLSKEAAAARKAELDANDTRSAEIMQNPLEAKGNSEPALAKTQAQRDEQVKVAKQEANKP